MKYIIETNGLTKKYGNFTSVKDLDLKVQKGKVYGFLGPNGAGKSTTIRMLLGLVKPTCGTFTIFNKGFSKNRMEILRKVGALVESPAYYGHLTAYENLEISRKILNLDSKRIDEVLELVRLGKWKNKAVKKFSLGMKQRLGIAQALLGNPELLILDEPTNGLDPAGIQEIRELIIKLPKETGMTVMVSSHILKEIEIIAEDVGIINNGKLLFQGSLEKLEGLGQEEFCINVESLENAANFLNREGIDAEVRERRVFLKAGCINSNEVIKKLIFNDFNIKEFYIKKKSLEEIFLDLTKEGGSL
jgi:ABC-type multidrug transport system ATPase subunit